MLSFLKRFRSKGLDCGQVAEVIQSYLDDQTDPELAKQVAEHLDDCLRCGLEAETYRSIKTSLGNHRAVVPQESLSRLRDFGQRLIDEGPPPEAPPA